jgi:hypothetical protein
MKRRRAFAFCLGLCALLACPAYTQTRAPHPAPEEPATPMHAIGTFDVKMTPQTEEKADGSTLSRLSMEKEFHGDLEATSKGEMLGARTEIQGSAGYVAMEHVTGKLQDRSGSFVLQHAGTMTRGALQLTVTVVPDSGSGQLAGIAGTMTIKIENGKHFYDFAYTLAAAP